MTAVEPNAPGVGENLRTDLEPGAIPGQATVPSSGDPSAATAVDEVDQGVLAVEQYLKAAGSLAEAEPPTLPRVPLPPLPFRLTSGRYRSPAVGFQLELRIDIDGRRPLRKLSGDYFTTSGATTAYFGSWTVDAVTVSTSETTVTIVGTARTTWQTTFTVATVTVPRRRLLQPPAPATLRWSTPSGAQGATYSCQWASAAFRTVQLEQDRENGVVPFASYDTGSLPSGGPARTLSTAAAYAEAGIQMLDTGGTNTIATPANFIWNNASLHNAMQNHFSRWQEQPQFSVWLLHAMRHEIGSSLRGIMFDQQGLQRQGCASFYQVMGGQQPANLREQVYVAVHELGHCFNLFHSFHKDRMTPPLPNRLGALSWMNYPGRYQPPSGPGGEAAFWAAFPFQFDDLELAHLRHGFRNAVIMGGNPFGTGAALEVGDQYSDLVSDRSGLSLTISPTDAHPQLGKPGVLEIRLVAERTQQIHAGEQLHPKYGFVQLAISRPRGDVVAHEPPVVHCAKPDLVVARGIEDAQVTSAYIGYDSAVGQVFEDPGTYRIRAAYAASDGSLVLSNVAIVRVTAPRTQEDEQVADLMLGDQTGMALTLLGSDSRHLDAGREALETVIAEHGSSPAAVYARLAVGVNAARPFIDVAADGQVLSTREPELKRADELLSEDISESRDAGGLDEITLYQAAAHLAHAHDDAGDASGARSVRNAVSRRAKVSDLPRSVLASLTGSESRDRDKR
jgi:hypothetical protein